MCRCFANERHTECAYYFERQPTAPREPDAMAGKHKNATEDVSVDLPITPMLDMSFQLMAFFIFTFRPAPTEGQIGMALPKEEGSDSATAIPNITDDKPVSFVVRVLAARSDGKTNGTIGDMFIRDKDKVGDETRIGPGFDAYRDTLKARRAALGGKASKLTLEFEDGIVHEHMVRLLDLGIGVGFEDIAPVPLNKPK
mgnify:CR=1 FL=1